MTRVVYLHGNGTRHWSFGWAGWLQQELATAGYETCFETLPDSILARKEYWLGYLSDHVDAGADDVLVGWSSGAVAAMRYAESHRIAGSVLVAPSYTDLNDEMERLSGYFDDPWRWAMIRENQQSIHLVTAANDPYISQHEFDTIADSLEARRTHFPDGGHFVDRTTFPEIVECVRAIQQP